MKTSSRLLSKAAALIRTKKRLLILILGVLFAISIVIYAYHWHVTQSFTNYPQQYPYTCYPGFGPIGNSPCHVTEDEGKVRVAQRPEVMQLVQQYGRKGVIIRALEFKDIQDKAFLQRLLGNNYVELGCIIEVAYPGGRYVYLENDKLDVIQRLNGAQFDDWLRTAPASDVQKYYAHLH